MSFGFITENDGMQILTCEMFLPQFNSNHNLWINLLLIKTLKCAHTLNLKENVR